jgi:putative N6-adenine-specific DNA methylase
MSQFQYITPFPELEGKTFEMVAKTFEGFEELLVSELTGMGAQEAKAGFRAVEFKGDLNTLYRTNISSRLALRILVPWVRFRAQSPEQLYRLAMQLPFEQVLELRQTFAIDAAVSSTIFTHSQFASLKLKDAIADRFRQRTGERPNVEVDRPDIRFNLLVREDEITILIDSSGESLHKRGYRGSGGSAPINEALAAGLLLMAGYDGSQPLLDPMCGSGTILCEALLIASRQLPNAGRHYYSFRNWKSFDEAEFAAIRKQLLAMVQTPQHIIAGSDISKKQLALSREHLDELKFGERVQLSLCDFLEVQPPEAQGILIMNPPYGERLPLDEAEEFYGNLGSRFKHSWSGWKVWIISSHLEALKRIGLKPFRKKKMYNGPLECLFLGYDMFRGTLKEKKSEN